MGSVVKFFVHLPTHCNTWFTVHCADPTRSTNH